MLLRWMVIFLVLALIFAVFGFGGIAGAFTDIAVILFWVAVAALLISLVFRLFSGSRAV
jgi:uncharacterized membrane protein YtjA (UPF0391 family)